MAKFSCRLNYSFGNEDWRTEQQALRIQPQDHVLCITASGDRPLNLLMNECQKIHCVDANPIQNYLLQLKMTAMRHLDYSHYLAFLGAVPESKSKRHQMLHQLLPRMNQEVAKFWLTHAKMIEKGVLYQGVIERLTKIVASCLAVMRGKKIKRLFAMDDLLEQRKFMQEEWDNTFWRNLLKFVLNPLISRFVLEDPGLANVGTAINPGLYVYERISASLDRDLAKKNLLLSLLFRGEVLPEAFSPYLREEGIQVIKSRLSHLEIFTQDIVEHLESISPVTFDAFSLSDVASYISYPRFVCLLQNIIRTAKPGARFCLRQFLSAHEIPKELQPYFQRDTRLEKELEQQDNCSIYRFTVGTVVQSTAHSPKELFVRLKEEQVVQV